VTRNVSVDTGPSRYTQNISIAARSLVIGGQLADSSRRIGPGRRPSVPVDAMVSIDTFVQLFRLQAFCVIANVHHA
jgi:hypothetical protein